MTDERTERDEHDDPAALAAGYALGALTPDETAIYEAFLHESADARDEHDSFRAVTEALAYDAPAATPSPDLKAWLLAAIATTPQLPAEDDLAAVIPITGAAPLTSTESAFGDVPAVGIPVAQPMGDAVETTPVGRAETTASLRWFRKPAVWVASAAAVAAIIVGGITVAPAIGQAQFEQRQTQALSEIQNAPDAQEATASIATGENARVIWSGSLAKSVMMIDDLDALPDDKTYELWYIGENGPISAGTFESAGSGETTWRVLDGSMSAGDMIGVTVEPEGGSEKPTSDPIVVVPTA